MSTALITGATSGIGAAFTRRLAAARYDLVLVARDTARLDQMAAAVRDGFGVRAEVIPADLTVPAQRLAVEDRLAATDRPVDVLVNNAGYALNAPFAETSADDQDRLLDVLVRSVMRLTSTAVPGMIDRGRGAVINVSSVAAFIPHGTYSAAKAWVTVFSESLAAELAGTGVRVLALCPGYVHTEFHARAGIDMTGVPEWMWLEADETVEAALRDLRRGTVVSVPSPQYKALAAMARYAPRGLVARVSRQFSRRR